MDKLTRTYKQVYMQMLKNICRAAIQSSGDFSDNFFRVFKMFKIYPLFILTRFMSVLDTERLPE